MPSFFFFFYLNLSSNRRYFNEKGNQIDEKNLDEIEQEYNRLVPEYNQLIDYLENVSQRFSRFQEDFHFDQVRTFAFEKKIHREDLFFFN